jgi:hypothetical protein
LVQWIANRQLPELHEWKGAVGVHLLEGDESASGIRTDEMRLRGGGDQIADLILLVEGYDLDGLMDMTEGPLSAARLVEQGAEAERHVGLYRAVHIVTEADLPG